MVVGRWAQRTNVIVVERDVCSGEGSTELCGLTVAVKCLVKKRERWLIIRSMMQKRANQLKMQIKVVQVRKAII